MFFKKSPVQKLNKQYKQLIKEAHKLSTVDRSASDRKYFEAEKVAEEIVAYKMKE